MVLDVVQVSAVTDAHVSRLVPRALDELVEDARDMRGVIDVAKVFPTLV